MVMESINDSMTVFEKKKKKKNINGNFKKIANYKIDKILSKLRM